MPVLRSEGIERGGSEYFDTPHFAVVDAKGQASSDQSLAPEKPQVPLFSVIRASIIVPTRNRARKLTHCLRHILAIRSRHSWELIVVDNGSTDRTAQMLDAFARQWKDVRMRIVRDPVPGGAQARNAGAKAARGEILIFIDDDCYVRPDIIDCYCDIFDDPTIGFAGGRVLLHDRTDYPLTVNESEFELRFPAAHPVPCGIVQGGNMAVRRQAWLEVGGFDERMGPAMRFVAEDWDIQTRIGIRGWAGGYFPGPTVSHHHGRKRAEARKRIRAYDVGSGAVYLKLIADRAARRIYMPHILRRLLGDINIASSRSSRKSTVRCCSSGITGGKGERGGVQAEKVGGRALCSVVLNSGLHSFAGGRRRGLAAHPCNPSRNCSGWRRKRTSG